MKRFIAFAAASSFLFAASLAGCAGNGAGSVNPSGTLPVENPAAAAPVENPALAGTPEQRDALFHSFIRPDSKTITVKPGQ